MIFLRFVGLIIFSCLKRNMFARVWKLSRDSIGKHSGFFPSVLCLTTLTIRLSLVRIHNDYYAII
jgi:hypothetical protein